MVDKNGRPTHTLKLKRHQSYKNIQTLKSKTQLHFYAIGAEAPFKQDKYYYKYKPLITIINRTVRDMEIE